VTRAGFGEFKSVDSIRANDAATSQAAAHVKKAAEAACVRSQESRYFFAPR
jgi:hypothetical protein